ncbi:DUF6883 domain-containing protein [Phormidesmis priestleyi]
MRMPFGLIVQDQKLTEYLLVFQEKDDKSGYLALAGYTLENWQLLKQDILKATEGAEVAQVIFTGWGTRFKVESQWSGINGRSFDIITLWQQDEGSDTIRFITLYPNKSRED